MRFLSAAAAALVAVLAASGCQEFPFEVLEVETLTLQAESVELAIGDRVVLSARNAAEPVRFALVSGEGSVDADTGLFLASGRPGIATIEVVDALGYRAEASIVIHPALRAWAARPAVAVDRLVSVRAEHGVAPYRFSIAPGSGGSVDPREGVVRAPSEPGRVRVLVHDARGHVAEATLEVVPVLSLRPGVATIAVDNSVEFVPGGGMGPYAMAVVAGGGGLSGGTFTAPANAGTAKVRVTDSLGDTADALVTINAALAFRPYPPATQSGDTLDFEAEGGVPPYAFSLVSGAGGVTEREGVFRAPEQGETSTIRVTDSLGNTADATVKIEAVLSISPAQVTVLAGASAPFVAEGGIAPYAFTVVSGGGTVDPATGAYVAGDRAGAATVRVTDSVGHRADASVVIYEPLALAPGSVRLAVGNRAVFAAAGGSGSYAFSVASGGGSIDPATGAYTAPATPGTARVRVSDSFGGTASADVEVFPALALGPELLTIPTGAGTSFSATGGVPPYSFSVASGLGTIGGETGAYLAPPSPGESRVRVTDSLGNTASSVVTVVPSVSIGPARAAITVANTLALAVAGGLGPFVLTVSRGPGTVLPDGVYLPNMGPGTATVQVRDVWGQTATAEITVYPPVILSPARANLAVGGALALSTTGGVPPLTYSVVSGAGSIDAVTGRYTAPAAAQEVAVRVTDALGNRSDGAIHVYVPGDLDPEFGTAGETTTDLAGYWDRIHSLRVDSSGRVVAAGHAEDSAGNSDFALVRYGTDGALDPSFGTGGRFLASLSSTDDVLNDLLILPDGRIAVAGYSFQGGKAMMAVALLTESGALDPSFGVAGALLINPLQGNDYANALAMDAAATRFAVAGQSGSKAVVAYATAAGSLDASVASSGLAVIGAGNNSTLWALAFQIDGKLVYGGTSSGRLLLGRLDAAGAADPSFGPGGVGFFTRDLTTTTDAIESIRILPDGKILVSGTAGTQVFVHRCLPDGTPDASFGTNSTTLTSIGASGTSAKSYSMAVDSAGRILLAGKATVNAADSVAVVRYLANGEPDLAFGGGMGFRTHSGAGARVAFGIGLELPDERIVVGGSAGTSTATDFLLLRLLP